MRRASDPCGVDDKIFGELARRAGIDERYAREWLEQQAVAGLIDVDYVGAPAGDRRYRLSAEHAQVLLDRDSPTYVTPYGRMFVAAAQQPPALMQAYREGGGVNGATSAPT